MRKAKNSTENGGILKKRLEESRILERVWKRAKYWKKDGGILDRRTGEILAGRKENLIPSISVPPGEFQYQYFCRHVSVSEQFLFSSLLDLSVALSPRSPFLPAPRSSRRIQLGKIEKRERERESQPFPFPISTFQVISLLTLFLSPEKDEKKITTWSNLSL